MAKIKIGDIDSGRDTNVSGGDLTVTNAKAEGFDRACWERLLEQFPEFSDEVDQVKEAVEEPKARPEIQDALQKLLVVAPSLIKFVLSIVNPKLKPLGLIASKIGNLIEVKSLGG